MKPIWVAVLSDGGVFAEGPDRTWDDVPSQVRIRFLQIRDLDGGNTLASLSGFTACYALNESTAFAGRQGMPSAKIIGGIMPDGKVREIRLEYRIEIVESNTCQVSNGATRKGAS